MNTRPRPASPIRRQYIKADMSLEMNPARVSGKKPIY